MHRRALFMVVAFVASLVALPSTGAAGMSAKAQRVMLVQKHRAGDSHGTFVLHVLTPGPLRLDSGRYDYVAAERPYVVRKGQWAAVYVGIQALVGKAGTLFIRWRAEFVGAGNGSTVGTGTWVVVRGTGIYARATGGGRLATVTATPRGMTSSQLEGLVRRR
jgi:hypothetical protein